jgi:hypothetical protein
MFMGPGMVEFFADMKRNLLQQGMDESSFRGLFSGIKGLVLLDTCGDKAKLLGNLSALGMGLEVVEVLEVGLGGVLRVVLEAVERG